MNHDALISGVSRVYLDEPNTCLDRSRQVTERAFRWAKPSDTVRQYAGVHVAGFELLWRRLGVCYREPAHPGTSTVFTVPKVARLMPGFSGLM